MKLWGRRSAERPDAREHPSGALAPAPTRRGPAEQGASLPETAESAPGNPRPWRLPAWTQLPPIAPSVGPIARSSCVSRKRPAVE